MEAIVSFILIGCLAVWLSFLTGCVLASTKTTDSGPKGVPGAGPLRMFRSRAEEKRKPKVYSDSIAYQKEKDECKR
jgi:hypothetical protein